MLKFSDMAFHLAVSFLVSVAILLGSPPILGEDQKSSVPPASSPAVQTQPDQASKTGVIIEVTDPDGNEARIRKAEILFCSHQSSNQRVALVPQGNSVRFPLGADWARRQFGTDRGTSGRIYLEIEGLASACSEGFSWVHGEEEVGYPAQASTEIRFPRDQQVLAEEGSWPTLSFRARKQGIRRLLFVDDESHPLPQVKLTSYRFWCCDNHCSVLSGAERLGTSVSNEQGICDVPDAEIEYAFEFEKADYRRADVSPDEGYPMRWVTTLSSDETLVRLHRMPRQPLHIIIRNKGLPGANIPIIAYMSDCPCGACWGPRWVSDANGEVHIDDFQPEAWGKLAIESEEAGQVWKIDPRSLRVGETIQVDVEIETPSNGQ